MIWINCIYHNGRTTYATFVRILIAICSSLRSCYYRYVCVQYETINWALYIGSISGIGSFVNFYMIDLLLLMIHGWLNCESLVVVIQHSYRHTIISSSYRYDASLLGIHHEGDKPTQFFLFCSCVCCVIKDMVFVI